MIRPKNWENVQAFEEYEPLDLGGHICKIMKVEETKSQKTQKDMLIVYLDIAEGEQKNYYANQYKADTRPDKKWGCRVFQLTEDADGNTSRGFKTFISAVEKSNPGFDSNAIWDEQFAEYFKDKLIGGVFGREQYLAADGKLKWSTKCRAFRDIDTIKKGVAIPEDKYLNGAAPQSDPFAAFPAENDNDDDLTF